MIIRISKDDRRNLEGITAILAASIKLKATVNCGLLASIIRRIPDQQDDELFALLSNAEHAVLDLYSDPFWELQGKTDNVDYAIACITRLIEYRVRKAA